MDSQLDTPSVVAAQDPEGPSPWIPLGPAHLFFWVVLIWPLVSGLVFSPVMRLLGPRAGVFSWFFTAVFWALGGGAILLGFKGMQTENPGSAQRGAFIATIVIWLLQVAFGLVLRFQAIKFGDGWHTYLRVSPLAAPILAAVPMILLLASREEQSGGTFDASTASLALLGGLGFLGPFLLAFGVLIGGHPLMAAVWEALRHPSEAMKGEWFDGGDEALKGRVFGQMALAFALSAPLLVLLMLTVGRFGRSGFDMSATHWIRPVAAWLTSLLSALVALRTTRRSGTREGRGMAIAALVLFGLLILPALALAVFLLLLATHMIRL
ncbi:MAG: hypothetical protein IPP78_06330 [Holophagaceae bacterium]|nr:hypothetical protein [Holophagaceae bacterium]